MKKLKNNTRFQVMADFLSSKSQRKICKVEMNHSKIRNKRIISVTHPDSKNMATFPLLETEFTLGDDFPKTQYK